MASRERQRRKDFRGELEGLLVAEGYKLADVFPQLAGPNVSRPLRRKLPVKFRDPQNGEHTRTGVGRTPRWVQSILGQRGIDLATFKSIPMHQASA